MKPKTKPESELAKTAAQGLKRAAKGARSIARQYGTPIHVQAKGEVWC